MVKVLDKVYTNCIDQTSSRLFYAISAAENLLIFGSDVYNEFAEAPPPKQGFYIRPDRVVSRLDMYHTKVLMYCTMVLLACLTKVRR